MRSMVEAAKAIQMHAAVVAVVLAAGEVFAQEQGGQQKPQREVVVSIADRKLAVLHDGEVVAIYPVAVGKASTPSPTGTFRVVNRLTFPTYYHKGQVIPPGPENPLGSRWIGLSEKGYGIHGTNAPRSIGKAASHGCIRMSKSDLEELFELLRPGDSVSILGEADERVASIFGGGEPAVVLASAQQSSPATVSR